MATGRPPRVVVVGGGIAGLYFVYELTRRVDGLGIVVVDPNDSHEFPIGIPMAFAGLVDFGDLYFPFSRMKKVTYIRGAASVVEGNCVRLAVGPVHRVCGDYVVLAPGGVKIGSAKYWSVSGAAELYRKLAAAEGVRFVVNVETPVMGFQEVAYSIKSRFPDKKVSIHLVYVGRDYSNLLSLWARWAESVGVELSEELPPLDGTLHVSVPALVPHPLAAGIDVDPATFEARGQRVYVIGDAALIKLGLPPTGWGALWQASTLAKAVASEIGSGVFEVEAAPWDDASTADSFYKWLTYKMKTGTPLAHLKGLLNHWRAVVKFLEGT